jgi:hypothetical protein
VSPIHALFGLFHDARDLVGTTDDQSRNFAPELLSGGESREGSRVEDALAVLEEDEGMGRSRGGICASKGSVAEERPGAKHGWERVGRSRITKKDNQDPATFRSAPYVTNLSSQCQQAPTTALRPTAPWMNYPRTSLRRPFKRSSKPSGVPGGGPAVSYFPSACSVSCPLQHSPHRLICAHSRDTSRLYAC